MNNGNMEVMKENNMVGYRNWKNGKGNKTTGKREDKKMICF